MSVVCRFGAYRGKEKNIIEKNGIRENGDYMLNAIWAGMILLAVCYGAVTGHMEEVTTGALEGAGDAVSLCITMVGVVALWMGLMEIASEAGLIQKLTKWYQSLFELSFSEDSEEPSCERIHSNEYHCQYFRTGLGMYTSRAKGDGGTCKSGDGKRKQRVYGKYQGGGTVCQR